MEQDGKLSATQAKTVLADMLEHGGDPVEIARRMGFEALATDSLAAAVAEVVAAHPDEWQRYVAGEDKLVGFFTGARHAGHERPGQRQGRRRGAAPPPLLSFLAGASPSDRVSVRVPTTLVRFPFSSSASAPLWAGCPSALFLCPISGLVSLDLHL